MAEWHMLPSWLPPTYVPECLLLACWGLGLATLWPLCSSQLRRPVTDVEPQRRFGPLWSILAVRIGSPRRISDLCRQAAKSLAPAVVTPAAIVAIPPNGECRYLNVVLASFTCNRRSRWRRYGMTKWQRPQKPLSAKTAYREKAAAILAPVGQTSAWNATA